MISYTQSTCKHYTCSLLHHNLRAQKVLSASQPNQVASLNVAYTPNIVYSYRRFIAYTFKRTYFPSVLSVLWFNPCKKQNLKISLLQVIGGALWVNAHGILCQNSHLTVCKMLSTGTDSPDPYYLAAPAEGIRHACIWSIFSNSTYNFSSATCLNDYNFKCSISVILE